MKTIKLLALAVLMNMSYSFGQISLDHVYNIDAPTLTVKLSLSGVKYCGMHYAPSFPYVTYFDLYNPDHSIFRTINIPQIANKSTYSVAYISETLFDLDSLIEYIVYYYDLTTAQVQLQVLNENGNVLLAVDSVVFSITANDLALGYIGKPIIYDGTQTKLCLIKPNGSVPLYVKVYNLPGNLTCVDCNNGLVNAIAPPHEMATEEKKSLAYPNPATEFIKIKYELPAGYRHAVVNLLDITGKLIRQKQIGEHFNEIYISSEELNQGAYIYQIVVDDKVATSGKVIKL